MAETQNYQDYINKMYDANLESQKQQLQTDYETNASELAAQQEAARKAADANLSRTYVEAQKAAKNYAEVQNAYGLTSGAMAQARLAQDNQLQADLTTIRAAQQEADADIERQRGILSQQYAAAISQAQADNDLQRAQALYEEAKAAESQLLGQQKEAASLMAGAGDFSLYQNLYGLKDEQMAALKAAYGEPASGSSGGGTGGSGGYGGGSTGLLGDNGGKTGAEESEVKEDTATGSDQDAAIKSQLAAMRLDGITEAQLEDMVARGLIAVGADGKLARRGSGSANESMTGRPLNSMFVQTSAGR